MQAAMLSTYGAPPRVESLPDLGAPGDHDVIVRMLRSPINPADKLSIVGQYSSLPTLPAVLGAEGVGIVLEIGRTVRNASVGDRVAPLSRGNWATHRVLNENDLVRVPSDLPVDQAAMLRINPATAWRLLHVAQLKREDWIIQNGAASSVAALVRVFARMRRVNVINVVRKGSAPLADAITVEDGPELAQRVAAASGGAPISCALDCVAGSATGDLAACLGPNGQLIVFGHLSGQPCSIPSALLTGKQLITRGFSLRPVEATEDQAALQAFYDTLATTVSHPDARMTVRSTFALHDLEAALRAAHRPGSGRVLLALDA